MERLTLRDDNGRALLTPYGLRIYCSAQATADCICKLEEALQAQEPHYPVCERCGKPIDSIKTSVFQYDGTDSEYQIPLTFDEKTGCVVFETTQNWTGYELTDEERKEGIRCPHCGEYPFDSSVEIEFYEPVEVLMWTSRPTDEQREKVKWE